MVRFSPLLLIFTSTLLISVHSKLTFRPDGTFTILQITDLHYEGDDAVDYNNTVIQDKLIKRVKPDMVAVTGDVVSGWLAPGLLWKKSGFISKIWKQFMQPFTDNDTPYAFVMGNHDTQGDLDDDGIFQLEKNNPYSLCANAQEGSYEHHNYYLPVYSATDNDKVVALLWVFNSHSDDCMGLGLNGCVLPGQVEWYKAKSKELRKLLGDDIHQIAFFHIALPEYVRMYNDFEFYGHKGDPISPPIVQTELFQAIQEGGITATFVGHDHYNDLGGFYKGVEFVYGRKSGYGSYGGDKPDFQRGARVIELKETKDENGKILVTREHYVIVEHPEKDITQDEDVVAQKVMRRRNTEPQDYSDEVTVEHVYNWKRKILLMVVAGLAILVVLMRLGYKRVVKRRQMEIDLPQMHTLTEER